MKQLGLSVLQYTMDNDGRLMAYIGRKADGTATNDWNRFEAMQSYIRNRQIVSCPSAPAYNPAAGLTGAWSTQYGFPADSTNKEIQTAVVHYSPGYLNHPTTTAIDSLPNAAQTCLLSETNYSTATNVNYLNNGYGGSVFGSTSNDALINWLNRNRHLEGGNYIYMDGHAKWLKKGAVDGAYVQQLATGATEATAANMPIVFAWAQ